MDPPRTRFVVTPWRDSKELLRLRHDLYASDTARKESAVNKVSWLHLAGRFATSFVRGGWRVGDVC